MIEPNLSAAFDRLGAAERDALGAYRAGFEPELRATARPSAPQPSADPLSAVAPEGAYFVTGGANGELRYSRDGAFVFENGGLCDAVGAPVFGFAPGEAERIVPLRADPIDVALGRAGPARIEADGTFAYERVALDPRTGERRGERVVVGRVALARFAAGTQPARVDATHVAAPAGAAPRFGVPASGAFAALVPHTRDAGHVDPLVGLEKMREAFDAFEAIRAAGHARGALERGAMDLLK